MQRLWLLLILLLSLPICAQSSIEPLPVDQAFQFSATAKDNQTFLGIWKITPGYYLYRDRIHFSPARPEQDRLGQPLFPDTSHMKDYPSLGELPVYTGLLRIPVPVIYSAHNNIIVHVYYQGCAEEGFCYPPTTKTVVINLAGNYMTPVQPIDIDLAPAISDSISPPWTQEGKIAHLLKNKNLFLILIGFFGFGVLLSLTPCVLPMIPILSGIIVGQKKLSHARAFGLSVAYVLGMAITYAIAGVIVGYIGGSLQAAFQQPWVIILFSLIFVVMALSLFGLYNIQLPAKLRNTLSKASSHQKHGSYVGTALMGCLSTLILSPCVTPPLVGVLGYISQTGNAILGGTALFIMGLGMGTPLLIIGASSAKLLPKSGRWMNTIKYILGILLLGVAIWMLSRILPGPATLALWAMLLMGSSIGLGAFSSAPSFGPMVKKLFAILLFVYGIVLAIGALTGHSDPFHPLTMGRSTKQDVLPFIPVKTVTEINQQLQLAQAQGQLTLLDFYADWCISCKEMDYFTFRNKAVQKALANFRLLRANVTKNDAQDKMLEKHFHVIAPPTILFFGLDGKEIYPARIIGEMSAKTFLAHIEKTKTCRKNRQTC